MGLRPGLNKAHEHVLTLFRAPRGPEVYPNLPWSLNKRVFVPSQHGE